MKFALLIFLFSGLVHAGESTSVVTSVATSESTSPAASVSPKAQLAQILKDTLVLDNQRIQDCGLIAGSHAVYACIHEQKCADAVRLSNILLWMILTPSQNEENEVALANDASVGPLVTTKLNALKEASQGLTLEMFTTDVSDDRLAAIAKYAATKKSLDQKELDQLLSSSAE